MQEQALETVLGRGTRGGVVSFSGSAPLRNRDYLRVQVAKDPEKTATPPIPSSKKVPSK